MTQTITRLYDSHAEARRAVEELEAAGVDHDRISLVASNADESWGRDAERRHDDDDDGDNDAAEGAAKGATTGGLIGGGAGLLAGLGLLAIPGLGPVVAAGWLVSTLALGAAGAAAGGAAGGLLGALKDAGHSDEEAHVYAEGVRRGGSLVSVRADEDDVESIRAILDGRGSVDVQSRGADYRRGGWTGFDAEAPPYRSEEIAAERARYAEQRTFAGRDATEDEIAREEARGADSGVVRPIRGADV